MITFRWPKHVASGTHLNSIPQRRNYTNAWTYSKKNEKEAFGSQAQQYVDKAIFAKMPDHVQKKLNRAYLEDKPYNEIVLHLEREMRLNDIGIPNEILLISLNKIEQAQTRPKQQPTEDRSNESKRGYCFCCNKFGHFNAVS